MSVDEDTAVAQARAWCAQHHSNVEGIQIVGVHQLSPTHFAISYTVPHDAENAPKDSSEPSDQEPVKYTRHFAFDPQSKTVLSAHAPQDSPSRKQHNGHPQNPDDDDDDDDDDEDNLRITSAEAAEELAMLEQEQELSVDELRRLYGAPDLSTADNQAILAAVCPETAMSLAAEWYKSKGPYGATYTMRPFRAFKNAPAQWSIKFKVSPDTSFVYFRRFHMSVEGGAAVVTDWSEDPEVPPGVDYDPADDGDGDDDDETTLREDEEALGDDDDELADLQADNELSVEELMAKYYGGGDGDGDGDGKDDGASMEEERKEQALTAVGANKEATTGAGDGAARPPRGRRKRRAAATASAAVTAAVAAEQQQKRQQQQQQQQQQSDSGEVQASKRPKLKDDDDTASPSDSGTAAATTTATAATTTTTATATPSSSEDTTSLSTGPRAAHPTAAASAVDRSSGDDEGGRAGGARAGDGNEGGLEEEEDEEWCSDVEETDPFLQYMRRAAEDAAIDEEYVSSYKPPKIGAEYQAQVSNAMDASEPIRGETANKVWAPIPPGAGLSASALRAYEDLYRGRDERYEHALTALFHHNYDPEAARSAMAAYIEPHPWTSEEIQRLHQLVLSENRHFHRIAAQLPNRSTRSVIRCYYDTKKLRPRCLSADQQYVVSSDDEEDEEHEAEGEADATNPEHASHGAAPATTHAIPGHHHAPDGGMLAAHPTADPSHLHPHLHQQHSPHHSNPHHPDAPAIPAMGHLSPPIHNPLSLPMHEHATAPPTSSALDNPTTVPQPPLPPLSPLPLHEVSMEALQEAMHSTDEHHLPHSSSPP
ncbi:hypothetical protein PTSG_11976 [Salpingoeca rosetta]|uniref:Myb-like domain-containing protein n=1 Tax=Salpingoeca rosetta (strain ATCC 50818 / BSB-021) TaxID=946362 RepID=F2U4G6_SALR5|nr:uncharacterized protein PTSG_11976 [Salpingoeca rosetta]EGD82532.1 hypothetical protein PTSG_11976 [Salpingoeca rosetta]|eukprot:XP_004995768.1 hypothetical protein PTSG_11976 [Salpingoeca rosetta]